MLRSGVLQALAALWAGAAWAQLVISESPSAAERPFAVGVDRTGWAQARSNAAGQVMIESPEYPRGLWLHVADEAGQALAGIQVDYHGRPNGLVALHCVDPAGLRREMLLWNRATSACSASRNTRGRGASWGTPLQTHRRRSRSYSSP